MNPTLKGYDTYYPTSRSAASQQANGDATCMNEAYRSSSRSSSRWPPSGRQSSLDSGLSLPNAPARVYPIGFGDIFDPVLSPSATFRPTAMQFLANIAYWGNTGPNGATTLPDLRDHHRSVRPAHQPSEERPGTNLRDGRIGCSRRMMMTVQLSPTRLSHRGQPGGFLLSEWAFSRQK